MGASGHGVKPITPAPAVKIIYPEDVVPRRARSTGVGDPADQEE
jgi:hypothetical protein